MSFKAIQAPDLSQLAPGANLGLLEGLGFSSDGSKLLVRATYSLPLENQALHALWLYDLVSKQYELCLNTLMASAIQKSAADLDCTEAVVVGGGSQTTIAFLQKTLGSYDNPKLAIIRDGAVVYSSLMESLTAPGADIDIQKLSLSEDGRFLAIQTTYALASDGLDDNDSEDVYLIDLKTQQITRVNLANGDPGGSDPSYLGQVSVQNGFLQVSFSTANRLSRQDVNTGIDAYVWKQFFDGSNLSGNATVNLISSAGGVAPDLPGPLLAGNKAYFNSDAALSAADSNQANDAFEQGLNGGVSIVKLKDISQLSNGASITAVSATGNVLGLLTDSVEVVGSDSPTRLVAVNTSSGAFTVINIPDQNALNAQLSADGNLAVISTLDVNLGEPGLFLASTGLRAVPSLSLTVNSGNILDSITNDARISVSDAPAAIHREFQVDNGTWSSVYTLPKSQGVHTVIVRDTDAAGEALQSTVTFQLDTEITSPSLKLHKDSGGSNSDGITNNAALTFSSTATDVTRSITINGGPASDSYVHPTADGDYTVVVTDTDTAGNSSSSTLAFKLDGTIAKPTLALTDDTGTDKSDGITSSAALTISDKASDVTRSITINGGSGSDTYDKPTTDGNYTVVVTDTDTAGNSSSSTLAFKLDCSIAKPSLALTEDTGTDKSDRITSNAALTIGDKASDVTRSITINGGPASDSYVHPTTDGDYTVVVTDTDTAGNFSSNTLSFKLDGTIAKPTLALTDDTGTDKSDGITSSAALTIGDKASDVTRSITINGGPASDSFVKPTTDGDYTVVVTDTDTAGNFSSNTLSFKLDGTIAKPSLALTDDTGTNSNDALTNNAALTFSEKASDVTRSITINGGPASDTYVHPTADGDYTVVVTDTDTAGNFSSSTLSFKLDQLIAAPVLALMHPSSGGHSNTTNDGLITFTPASETVLREYKLDSDDWNNSYTPTSAAGAHTVWVRDTDLAGNQATAQLDFTVVPGYPISGSVTFWKTGQALPGVSMTESGQTATFQSNGQFSMSGVTDLDGPNDNTIELTPTKTAPSRNTSGITLTDVLATLKVYLNKPLASDINGDYKYIAADFNGDGSVNLTDVLGLLKYYLNKPTNGVEPSWAFVDNQQVDAQGHLLNKNGTALDKTNTSLPAPIDFHLGTDTSVQIVGVLRGDVDGSWTGA